MAREHRGHSTIGFDDDDDDEVRTTYFQGNISKAWVIWTEPTQQHRIKASPEVIVPLRVRTEDRVDASTHGGWR